MDYSCKAALRLIHEERAVKCFSMRGNKQCDVCGQEVSNLPVILLQPPASMQRNNTLDHNQQNLNPEMVSVLEYFVTPMAISSFCYFCLIEQPLAGDMQNEMMVIALACAVTLDLLSSTFVILLVINYIWTYAALQFALVATIIFLFHFSEYPVRRRGKTMQASDEITNSPPEDDARQGDLETGIPTEEAVNSGTSHPDLSLQIPPRPRSFGSIRSGKGLLHSGFWTTCVICLTLISNPWTVLSLRKSQKILFWHLAPVRPSASNLPPSVSAPVSASTSNMGLVKALESRFLFAERLEIMRVMEDFVMLVVISSFFYFFVVELPMVDDLLNEAFLVVLPSAQPWPFCHLHLQSYLRASM